MYECVRFMVRCLSIFQLSRDVLAKRIHPLLFYSECHCDPLWVVMGCLPWCYLTAPSLGHWFCYGCEWWVCLLEMLSPHSWWYWGLLYHSLGLMPILTGNPLLYCMYQKSIQRLYYIILQWLVIISCNYIHTLEVVIPLGYGIVYPVSFLFEGAPFSLSFCECVQEKSNRQFLLIVFLDSWALQAFLRHVCTLYITLRVWVV